MITIGIDPAWDKITFGVVGGDRESGYKKLAAETLKVKDSRRLPLRKRIEFWEEAIKKRFEAWGWFPSIVVLEIPDYLRGWVKNQRALMKLGLAAGIIWGILRRLQADPNIKDFELIIVDRTERKTFIFAPTKEKALARCAQRGWDVGKDHNKADALMLALYGHQVAGC